MCENLDRGEKNDYLSRAVVLNRGDAEPLGAVKRECRQFMNFTSIHK